MLQQYLPFTVLKRCESLRTKSLHSRVATVLTVYGIETTHSSNLLIILIKKLQQYLPFTVLKLLPKKKERLEY